MCDDEKEHVVLCQHALQFHYINAITKEAEKILKYKDLTIEISAHV
jgi:hypothetical protein